MVLHVRKFPFQERFPTAHLATQVLLRFWLGKREIHSTIKGEGGWGERKRKRYEMVRRKGGSWAVTRLAMGCEHGVVF